MQSTILTKLAADCAQRGALSSSGGRADLCDHSAHCRLGAFGVLCAIGLAACAWREGSEVRVDERVPSAVVAALRPVPTE
jgi:hypothetical protein